MANFTDRYSQDHVFSQPSGCGSESDSENGAEDDRHETCENINRHPKTTNTPIGYRPKYLVVIYQ
ncbi:MAG: hypothetical protein LBG58_10070 [Planctomycetaceae bacterium]|jgi:hypothetical protein|nr:hypothetical protein [Planctomycetaceae bacterium]